MHVPNRVRLPVKRVCHCDWSKDAGKRWMTVATWNNRAYTVSGPEQVGDVATLFDRLRESLDSKDGLLVGFDFPIGVPSAYADRAMIGNFRNALCNFGTDASPQFYEKCHTPDMIALGRPFYPVSCRTKGAAKREHLTEKLGINWDGLHRQCERAIEGVRNSACPLFWTLGGNQVGSAAISGWQEVLVPTLCRNDPTAGLWPFEGDLESLIRTHSTIIAETYPGEAYGHLKLPRSGWSKRRQTCRRGLADALFDWNSTRPEIVFDVQLIDAVRDGFGAKSNGEDQFDAFAGMCSMLDVVLGYRREGIPSSKQILNVEGWILGQEP